MMAFSFNPFSACLLVSECVRVWCVWQKGKKQNEALGLSLSKKKTHTHHIYPSLVGDLNSSQLKYSVLLLTALGH